MYPFNAAARLCISCWLETFYRMEERPVTLQQGQRQHLHWHLLPTGGDEIRTLRASRSSVRFFHSVSDSLCKFSARLWHCICTFTCVCTCSCKHAHTQLLFFFLWCQSVRGSDLGLTKVRESFREGKGDESSTTWLRSGHPADNPSSD